MSARGKANPKHDRPGLGSIAAVVGLAVVGVFGGLLVEESLRERGAAGITTLGEREVVSDRGSAVRRQDRPALNTADPKARAKRVKARESSGAATPWAAPAKGSAAVPEGHKTAAEIGSPKPAHPAKPVAPVPPADPQRATPPKHNPGGVNGKRPPRPIQ